jgi:hypothetical protein
VSSFPAFGLLPPKESELVELELPDTDGVFVEDKSCKGDLELPDGGLAEYTCKGDSSMYWVDVEG